ncbi:hypothetical protein M0R45_007272 [Rubus argutus]|uniref:Uncharacterized protein n=1 Tax=Rubus argutus TaxID=59490 RepID=A0AAW1XXS8_RUBAR
MNKTSDQAFDIFEILSENSQQFSTKGFQEVKFKDAYEMRASGGDSTRIAAIEEKLDAMMKNMSLQGAAQVEDVFEGKCGR